ncbi:hypothetical protein NL676_008456 [Syzygium grande]|nr:hypothetical protein NL676_008456 [Syzygium grande]
MESLEQLEIKECPKIKSLDDLSDLKKLKYLVIRGCEELPAVEGLDELETLKRLDFNRCRSLESFANVFNSKIRDRCCITIFNCSKLVDPSQGGLVSSYEQWKVQEMSNRDDFHWLKLGKWLFRKACTIISVPSPSSFSYTTEAPFCGVVFFSATTTSMDEALFSSATVSSSTAGTDMFNDGMVVAHGLQGFTALQRLFSPAKWRRRRLWLFPFQQLLIFYSP